MKYHLRQQLVPTILAVLAGMSFWGCNAGSDIISTGEGSCNDLVEFESNGIPGITASTSSIDFQYQTAGTISFPLSVTVMNEGAQSVTIERVVTNCGQFLLETAESLPLVLQSNLATKFSISFKPEDAVEFDPEVLPNVTGQLLVYFEGISEPLVVLLTGTGLAEDGILNIDSSGCGFWTSTGGSDQRENAHSGWNGGITPVTISTLSTVAPFRVFGFSGMTELQPATALELGVEFEPNAVGNFEQLLIIEALSPGFRAFIRIPLHGVGTE
ncbi:hypothetical protein IIA28_16205 [candidate division KSB1 bacterium]|nr:hypothetical protein [candidate division KSB1 bacterium]